MLDDLGETVALVAAGVAIGVPVSLAAARLVRGQLFGLAPADPLTFVAVTAILAAVALAAGYLPARRAATIDPLAALREEQGD